MERHDRGRLKIAVMAAIVVATVGLVITTGFVFAGDDPTGEDVLEDVQETYESTESVSADALVTVESDNETASVETQIAATADGQMRLNLSGQESYVTAGTDGDSVWVYEPQTDSSVGLAEQEDALRATLRAGTIERTVTNSVPIDDVSPGDTVADVLEEVDEDELPDEWQERIEELPRNATLAELAADGEFDDLLEDGDGSAPGNDSTATDVQSQVVADRLLGQLTSAVSLDAGDIGEIVGALNGEDMAGATNETGIAGVFEQIVGRQTAGDNASLPNETAQFTAVLGSADEIRETLTVSPENQTVELVGTTTVDGEETNELLLTSPTNEYELRLWADTETDEIRKVEWTGSETTITAEIRETRFDVSPADSTFEAPGAVELASVTATNTTASEEFATDAPFDVKRPDDAWTFERGSTVELETSFDTGTPLDDNPVTTVARYTDGERSLLVLQSSAVVDVPFGTETISVGNTTARLTEVGDRTIGVWTDEDTTTVVVGDFSEAELQSIISDLS